MTPVNLMYALANLLKEANKNYFLTDELAKDKKLIIVPGRLPIKDSSKECKTPSITPVVIDIEDEVYDGFSGKSTALVRIYIVTYNEDLSIGWQELYNLAEHTRQAILKKRTIGNKFELQLPLKSQFPEPLEQPDPNWIGFIEARYIVGQVKEVNYIDGVKY